MKKYALLTLLSATIILAGSAFNITSTTEAGGQTAVVLPQDPAAEKFPNGAKIYQAKCIPCHQVARIGAKSNNATVRADGTTIAAIIPLGAVAGDADPGGLTGLAVVDEDVGPIVGVLRHQVGSDVGGIVIENDEASIRADGMVHT